MAKLSAPRVVSRQRIVFAFIVAVITDGLQLALGPFGWVFADEGLDVLAMIFISWAIGFHLLLLPTFLIEFIPGPDMLPTWTGCTAAVLMLRRKPKPERAIDVASEVTPVERPNQASKPPIIEAQRAGGGNS